MSAGGPRITPLFPWGRVVITANAQNTLVKDDAIKGFTRHMTGDWGDLCEEDRQANEDALNRDLRLLSSYSDRNGTKFWIITEADRSLTTILLPEDY